MKLYRFLFPAMVVVAALAPAFAADAAGKWTAAIETQVGVQNYTYEFKVDGKKLTGTAKSQFTESQIQDGVVDGDNITFVENLVFQDMPLRVVYKGKLSGDEIKFSRNVADFANEDFVAKRAK